MALTDVFLTLGEDGFGQIIRGVSMGKLKTYQLYDRIKTRTHLAKLNAESLQKATPRLWTRLSEKDEEFAQDLSQAVLVCHLDMIVAVLNFLGVSHEKGFFSKNIEPKAQTTGGWQGRGAENFKKVHPGALLSVYT